MDMNCVHEERIKTESTLLFTVIFLFFIQLLGMWIESIYRVSLTRLGPGKELYGILLLLLPLVLFVISEKRERACLWVATIALLVARLSCPYLNTAGQVVVAGVGVSMFCVILACALSARFSRLKGDMGQAVGLAVLLSVAFRSWGSSADISTEGWGSGLGWLLALFALWQFRATVVDAPSVPPSTTLSATRRIVAMLGLFGNFALIYLVLSSPTVVCAWAGYASLGYSGPCATGCVALGFTLALLLAHRIPSPKPMLLLIWNALLLMFLVGGLYSARPTLPLSAPSPPLFVSGDNPLAPNLLDMALLLAPVIIFNVGHVAKLPPCARPRNAVLPVMAGMAFAFAVALLLIGSNVWGYVPYGRLLRNCFYLPFLIATVAMLMPWMLRHSWQSTSGPLRGQVLTATAVLLAILALTGAWVRVSQPQSTTPKHVLTILTYNLQQGSHINGNRNYSKQLDLLRSLNPDIIGLQESDTARPSGGNVDVVRCWAESMGYYAYYGPGSIAGTFGAAILSRYPIMNARSFFTYSDSDEVGTAMGEIQVGGTTIAFFSNHPSGAAPVMTAHVNALKGEAGRYTNVIAVGDYNFTAHEPFFASLSLALQDSATLMGEANVNFHGDKPNLADEIDHIFVSPNFRVLESHYLSPPDSQTDHPAHWSVLSLE